MAETKLSVPEALLIALERGLINHDEYDKKLGVFQNESQEIKKIKIPDIAENEEKLTVPEALKIALDRGLIKDDEYHEKLKKYENNDDDSNSEPSFENLTEKFSKGEIDKDTYLESIKSFNEKKPEISEEDINIEDRPSLLKYGSNAAKESIPNNLDFIGNIGDLPFKGIGWLLEKYGPEKVKDFIEQSNSVPYDGELTNLSKKAGFHEELPEPRTYGEKVAVNAGRTLGNVISASPTNLFNQMRTIPGALAQTSGLVGPALTQPLVERISPENKIGQMIANTINTIAFSYGGNKIGNAISPKKLGIPEKTNAQSLPLGSREAKEAEQKEFFLKQRYKKAKESGEDILEQQRNNIDNSFSYPESQDLTGKKYLKRINTSFHKARKELRDQYKEQVEPIYKSTEAKKIDLNPFMEDLRNARHIALDGTPFKEHLDSIMVKIISLPQISHPGQRIKNLNELKMEISKLTEKGALHFTSAEGAVFTGLEKNLQKALHKADPRLISVDDLYHKGKTEIEDTYKNIVSPIYKKGKKNPDRIFDFFGNLNNEEQAKKLQKILTPEDYELGAKKFVHNQFDKHMGKGIRNEGDPYEKYYGVRKYFQDNSGKLKKTLPSDVWQNVEGGVNDIVTSERGVRNFGYNSGKNIDNPVFKSLVPSKVKYGMGLITRPYDKLLYNQMMTRTSPLDQIKSMTSAGIKQSAPGLLNMPMSPFKKGGKVKRKLPPSLI